MKKILWVKFGWSDFYQGGPVDGNFLWVSEGVTGAEAFNFMPYSDGVYYCYVPPQGEGHQPWNDDPEGWTVVCLAKHPRQKGIHIIGWYENATLEGEYHSCPYSPVTGQRQTEKAGGWQWHYSIKSRDAFLVPPSQRTNPFSHVSVRRGKYSFLAGPEVEPTKNKSEVLKLIEQRLKGLRNGVTRNPDPALTPDPDDNPESLLRSFGTPEHRLKVEKAAERAVVAYYKKRGYSSVDRTKEKIGYDFAFMKGKLTELVEIKGTSGTNERFFMTRKEFGFKSNKEWRLAIVVNALAKNYSITVYNLKQFEQRFSLEPLIYQGTKEQVVEE